MNFIYNVVSDNKFTEFARGHKNGFFGALVLGLIALGSLTASLMIRQIQ